MRWLPGKEVLERVKLSVEIMGLILAGIFLFLGVVIPWFSNTSAEMEIRTARALSGSPNEDYLTIDVRLHRHGISQCDLSSVDAWVHNPFSSDDGRFVSFDVKAVQPTTAGVDFKRPRDKPWITLDPDDALQFSNVLRVPSEGPQIVDAIIRCGRATAGNAPEWRSSATSLPIDKGAIARANRTTTSE
jgi:hypothetical protein